MVLMEEKSDEIGANLECSPQKSLAKLAQQTNVSSSSARNATKCYDFYLFNYKLFQFIGI